MKVNIDAFRESPARFVAASLARRHGGRIAVAEPSAAQLPIESTGTGATLVDLDTALESCGVLIVLVDHDVFRVVSLAERANTAVYDTRGIWPEQPRSAKATEGLRRPAETRPAVGSYKPW